MEETNIGLAELIHKVKEELLDRSMARNEDISFLSVDLIELELQVTVKRESKGGIKIYVLEAGAATSQDEIQTVKITLSPLLNKETLLKLYQQQHPEQIQIFIDRSLEAMTKNVDDGSSLGTQF
jgi:Trypsin-co-occurring domain 2